MPKLRVFACPSCGASLSVDEGAATTKCQFCGNTVIVPEEIRGTSAATTSGLNPGGLATGAPLKDLGNLVRQGNKLAAIKLYRELFGGGLAEAQSAVDRLSFGQAVQVTYLGMPTTLVVDRSPTASFGSTPTVTPIMQPVPPIQPVIISGNPGRGLGCVMWSVFLTAGLGILITLLATTGALLPFLGMMGSDGELPFGLGDLMTSVPQIAATAEPRSTRQPPTAAATSTPSFVTEVLSFGEAGTGSGAFEDPRHIAVDGEGNIYVGEWSAHRVQVFDEEGDFVTQFSVGENDAILVAMAVDRAGAVFAVAGGRLYQYDGATGELLGQIEYGGENDFDDVVVTANDGLLTSWSSAREESIIRFDPNFDVDLELTGPIAAVTGDTELDMQLAVDGSGQIFALGTFHDTVYRFSPDGVFQTQFGGDGDEPGMFTAPSAITVDRQSRVYVSDFKGIQVFDGNGRYLAVFDVPDGGFVHGMTVDDRNFLYAVSNNSKVYKFALNP